MILVIKPLNNENVNDFVNFVYYARETESEVFFNKQINKVLFAKETRERMMNNLFYPTKTLLAYENERVIGRIEYHFYGCYMDGYKMAYVDWIYVLKEKRHLGVAKTLFRAFEEDCKKHRINQYFLIRATNSEAVKFYDSFSDVETKMELILRKDIDDN
jgi:GNAT superfamily N-acetyltransferase